MISRRRALFEASGIDLFAVHIGIKRESRASVVGVEEGVEVEVLENVASVQGAEVEIEALYRGLVSACLKRTAPVEYALTSETFMSPNGGC